MSEPQKQRLPGGFRYPLPYGKSITVTGLRIKALLDRIKFNDWVFVVGFDGSQLYLQVQADEPCSETGEMHRWHGRKWRLSKHMTDSEVIQTAFLAVMTAVEHETREQFTYRGHAVYSPHYDVQKLVGLLETGEAHDVRTPPEKEDA